ncbi:MAG: DinB family protein [Chloroflexi bacterium]|nr:DinB family protein [Chloroflexota bacterium]
MSLLPFYAGWRRYNELLTNAIGAMSDADLALAAPVLDTSGTGHWPIWAIAAHTAGTRVYWLCGFLGEPGLETVGFIKPGTWEGWEDDLTRPRTAEELEGALTASWAIVESSLRRWTPEMLDEAFPTPAGQHLTRGSLILRCITHDAYHAGEIALIQGMHGRPQLDLWPPGAHPVEVGGQAAR